MGNLAEAGAAGLIIIVVILFLRFLSEERKNRMIEHKSMMGFIAEQRKENNDTTNGLATALSTSLSVVTLALENLRECTIEHHQFTESAVEVMKAIVKPAKKAG
jgi:hypothetical protein